MLANAMELLVCSWAIGVGHFVLTPGLWRMKYWHECWLSSVRLSRLDAKKDCQYARALEIFGYHGSIYASFPSENHPNRPMGKGYLLCSCSSWRTIRSSLVLLFCNSRMLLKQFARKWFWMRRTTVIGNGTSVISKITIWVFLVWWLLAGYLKWND